MGGDRFVAAIMQRRQRSSSQVFRAYNPRIAGWQTLPEVGFWHAPRSSTLDISGYRGSYTSHAAQAPGGAEFDRDVVTTHQPWYHCSTYNRVTTARGHVFAHLRFPVSGMLSSSCHRHAPLSSYCRVYAKSRLSERTASNRRGAAKIKVPTLFPSIKIRRSQCWLHLASREWASS